MKANIFYILLFSFISDQGIHLYIISILLISIELIVRRNFVLKKKMFVVFSLFNIYIITFSFFSSANFISERDSVAYYSILAYSLLGFLFNSLLVQIDKNIQMRALKWITLIVFFIILIQYFIYKSFNYYLDIHKIITIINEPSRAGNNLSGFQGFIRPTVFYSEPGNLVAILYTISFLFILNNNQKWAVFVSLIAASTLSFTGIILFTIISFYYFIQFIRKRFEKKIFITVLTLFLLPISFYVFLNLFSLDMGYDAVSWRLIVYDRIYNRPFFFTVFGDGIVYVKDLVDFGGLPLKGSNINELLITSLIFSFGIIGIILLFIQLYIIRDNKVLVLFVVLAFLTKTSFNMPSYWIIFWAFPFYYRYQNNKMVL